jgi:Flp pilus assembly protein TadG
MKTHARHRGISLVFVAILLPVLIGIVGLAIDTTYVILTYQQLQVAADAAALAGATQLNTLLNPRPGTPVPPISSVYTAAAAVAADNFAGQASVKLRINLNNNSNASDVIVGQYSATSTPTFTPATVDASGNFTPSPNAVEAIARRDTSQGTAGPLPLLFGPIFGVKTININRQAIALLNVTPAVLVLSPSAGPALNVNSGASLSAQGGAVTVNSANGGDAVSVTGSGGIQATDLNVLQGAGVSATGQGPMPAIVRQTRPTTDPLANLPAPAQTADLGAISVSSGTTTLNPGTYESITVSGGNVTLRSGTYMLGVNNGTGLQVTGQGSLTALGVLVYLTSKGTLNLTSTGQIFITPDQSGTGTYSGVVIMQNPNDSQAATIQGSGGNLSVNGAIYVPGAGVTLMGRGDTIGSQIIANTVTVTGSGQVRLNYAGAIRPSAEQPTAYLAQ